MYQMKGRMQKTMAQANDYPRRDRSETEWYEEVQTSCGYTKTISWKYHSTKNMY